MVPKFRRKVLLHFQGCKHFIVSHLRRPHLDTEEETLMLKLDRKNCTSHITTQNFTYYNCIGVTSYNSACSLTFSAGGDVRRWRCTQNSVTSWRAFDAEEQMTSSTCPLIELWNNFCHCLIQKFTIWRNSFIYLYPRHNSYFFARETRQNNSTKHAITLTRSLT